MHLVVINSWKKDTGELTQDIAKTLGITAYEVKQRMFCGSPTVLASFADPQQARVLMNKMNRLGIATMVVDAAEVRSQEASIMVRRFKLNESSLRIETREHRGAAIPYKKIDVLLSAASTVTLSKTKTITEKKLSLGKTLLMGGIPMSKKVTHQQKVTSEDYESVLYLYIAKRHVPIIFRQNGMTYEGLGEAMQLGREMNFTRMINELHRLSPGAVYDDRLLKRIRRVQLLGPTLDPDTNMDLATEILVRSLGLSRS